MVNMNFGQTLPRHTVTELFLNMFFQLFQCASNKCCNVFASLCSGSFNGRPNSLSKANSKIEVNVVSIFLLAVIFIPQGELHFVFPFVITSNDFPFIFIVASPFLMLGQDFSFVFFVCFFTLGILAYSLLFRHGTIVCLLFSTYYLSSSYVVKLCSFPRKKFLFLSWWFARMRKIVLLRILFSFHQVLVRHIYNSTLNKRSNQMGRTALVVATASTCFKGVHYGFSPDDGSYRSRHVVRRDSYGVNCREPYSESYWESAAKPLRNERKVQRLGHGVQTGQ